jgi:hypothetical protein
LDFLNIKVYDELRILIGIEDVSFQTLCALTLDEIQLIIDDPDSDLALQLMYPGQPLAPGN